MVESWVNYGCLCSYTCILPSLETDTGVAVAAAAQGRRAKAVRERPRPVRGKNRKMG